MPDTPKCPRCGGGMRLRKNRSSGSQFWGCDCYPDCKGTRPFEGNEPLRVEVDCVQINGTLDSVTAAAGRLKFHEDADVQICVKALSALLGYVLTRRKAEDPGIWDMLDKMDRSVRGIGQKEEPEVQDGIGEEAAERREETGPHGSDQVSGMRVDDDDDPPF